MTKSKHVIFRSAKRKDGSKGIEAWSPEKVVTVHTHEELEAQLHHYSKLLSSHTLPDNPGARRHHVELVRPALRYYCKKFGVDAPKWLADDKYYTDHLKEDQRTTMFGKGRLRIGEFKNMRAAKVAPDAKEKGA